MLDAEKEDDASSTTCKTCQDRTETSNTMNCSQLLSSHPASVWSQVSGFGFSGDQSATEAEARESEDGEGRADVQTWEKDFTQRRRHAAKKKHNTSLTRVRPLIR